MISDKCEFRKDPIEFIIHESETIPGNLMMTSEKYSRILMSLALGVSQIRIVRKVVIQNQFTENGEELQNEP